MLFTTFQAVVRQPYMIIMGERQVDLFAGVLCSLSLALALILAHKKNVRPGKFELLASFALTALAIASGLASTGPIHSTLRGFVLLSSGLGGYWCSRLLLRGSASRAHFAVFCSLLFGIFLLLQIIGYLGFGSVHYFFDEFRHPQVSVALLLSFAPLTLMLSKQRPQRTIGLLLIAVCFFIFFLSGLRSAVFMPVAVTFVALAFGFVPLRWFLAAVAIFIVIGAGYFSLFPEKRMKLTGEPAYYRLENYPFSMHIAAEHPLLGSGIGVRRERYLKNYTIHYPLVNQGKIRMDPETYPGLGKHFPHIRLFFWFSLRTAVRRSSGGPLPESAQKIAQSQKHDLQRPASPPSHRALYPSHSRTIAFPGIRRSPASAGLLAVLPASGHAAYAAGRF